jgi:hypothetical protein
VSYPVVLGSITAGYAGVVAGPGTNLLIRTQTLANLSRRVDVLAALGVATGPGLSLILECFV